MEWKQRDPKIKTVKEFVMNNLGMDYSDILDGRETIGELNHYVDSFSQALLEEIESRTPINVVGDYDVDGVTSISIFYLLMQHVDKQYPVNFVIPKRFTDGYGINKRIIEGFDAGIILTFDNGISAYDALKEAKDKGFKVFLSDHHPLPDGAIIPPADHMIDLNVVGEGFCGYCGAGIAYNIALYIIEHYNWSDAQKKTLPWLKETLRSFAAIGTIADVMELTKQNREIVKAGLKGMLRKGKTIGLFALMEALKKEEYITSEDVAFYIGPCLNAPGRLYDDGAMKAFRLLTFNGDYEQAKILAEDLLKDNEERKKITEIHLNRVLRKISEQEMQLDYPLVVYVEDIPLGIPGILAGKIAERFHAPAIVVTNIPGRDVLTGSGRTYGDVHLKYLLDSCKEYTVAYGGHAGAAGIKLREDQIEPLRKKMQSMLTRPQEADYLYYDLEIVMGDIPHVIRDLKELAPFGEGNPAPVFKIKDFLPKPVKNSYYFTFDKKPDGIKLYGKDISALSFELKPKFVNASGVIEIPGSLDMLGEISENYFMGNTTWQIKMQDVAFAKKDAEPVNNLRSRLMQMAKERS